MIDLETVQRELPEKRKTDVIDLNKYKDFDTFFESLNEVLNDENNYRKHLTQSVYATANIASIKFFNVNKGLRHLLKSIIFLSLFFISIYAV